MKWKNVENGESPAEKEDVLVYNVNAGLIEIGRYKKGTWTAHNTTVKVSHWMPLPDMPEDRTHF